MEKRNNKNFLYKMLCGFFLGVSVIAPGVSGSVMAVMMGIYRDLIDIISNPFKNFKRNVLYILPMGIGAVISLGLFVKLLSFLFENYPAQARILFMGLVAGGLPTMFSQANKGKFKAGYLYGIVCSFLVASLVGVVARLRGSVAAPAADVGLLYLCVSSCVAGASSMIPGMSVSMVLMLFGVYDFLLKSASAFTNDLLYTITFFAPIGFFFVLGMVVFSNLTKYVFEKYTNLAYFMVFGFMVGTLTAIFPSNIPTNPLGILGCVISLVVGICISFVFQSLGRKFNVD